jgi:flagellar basal-body rod modification protein FlgD
MIDTTAIQGSPTPTQAVQGPNQTLGQDQFLNLLLTQLKNQDPLKPEDSSTFIAQLAQFSQVEQSKQTTDALNSLLKQQNNSYATGLVSLMGHNASVIGSTFSHVRGSSDSLNYVLKDNAAKVTAQVLDAGGHVVRTLQDINKEAGGQSILWDGKDQSGNTMPSGPYTFSVSGSSSASALVSADTITSGVVSGVRFDAGGPMVVLDSGQAVAPNNILSVR